MALLSGCLFLILDLVNGARREQRDESDENTKLHPWLDVEIATGREHWKKLKFHSASLIAALGDLVIVFTAQRWCDCDSVAGLQHNDEMQSSSQQIEIYTESLINQFAKTFHISLPFGKHSIFTSQFFGNKKFYSLQLSSGDFKFMFHV